MRVADHLFAVLGREKRRIGWRGGEACYGLRQDGWRLESCDGSRFGREIVRRLEASAYRPRVHRIGLSGRERERLHTLGYLR